MTDYTTKTDAELDALAAERMGWEPRRSGPPENHRTWLIPHDPDPPTVRGRWSPTTDANDRDEWVGWLRAQGAYVETTWFEEGGTRAVVILGEKTKAFADDSIGSAVVIAGLRAIDD